MYYIVRFYSDLIKMLIPFYHLSLDFVFTNKQCFSITLY